MPRVKKTKVEEVVEEIENVELPVEETEEKPEKKSMVKITGSRVNIRKSPNLLGEVLTIAPAGRTFELVNDGTDGFYEIICDGVNAFVMKTYAELS